MTLRDDRQKFSDWFVGKVTEVFVVERAVEPICLAWSRSLVSEVSSRAWMTSLVSPLFARMPRRRHSACSEAFVIANDTARTCWSRRSIMKPVFDIAAGRAWIPMPVMSGAACVAPLRRSSACVKPKFATHQEHVKMTHTPTL
jgi:hypothetical protein